LTRAASIVVVLLLVGACGVGEGGLPLPRQEEGQSYPGIRQEVRGELEYSEWGCKNLVVEGTSYLVIWPAGSEETAVDDVSAIRLPGGQVIAEGDSVVGTGAYTPTEPLTANRDTPLAYWIGNCAADASEVIVLDSAERGS
jgi:hypothetical protein